jgi:predicted metal-dependent hydrolase
LSITWSIAMSDPLADLEIVRRSGARRMRLSVDPRSGAVRLVVPPRIKERAALDWAQKHKSWVARQRERLPAPWPIEPGMTMPFAGRDLTLDWVEDRQRGPVLHHDVIRAGGPRALLAPRILRWLRREAATLLDAETREFGTRADVSIGRVGVGDPRSRWGSCSSTGDIRYSWRLILAPAYVRRATVAHEVAHRVHMNHGPAFHALVAELFGHDPSPARHWLRHNGARLHWFGREA